MLAFGSEVDKEFVCTFVGTPLMNFTGMGFIIVVLCSQRPSLGVGESKSVLEGDKLGMLFKSSGWVESTPFVRTKGVI